MYLTRTHSFNTTNKPRRLVWNTPAHIHVLPSRDAATATRRSFDRREDVTPTWRPPLRDVPMCFVVV